eukprot:g9654.t1
MTMDEEARNNLNELINSYETLSDDIAREKSQLSAHRVPNDKVLAWRLRINYISQKALNHKVPHVDFLLTQCTYAERLMNLDQYGLVFQEIYERFSDLACQYVRERNYNVTHFAADESGVDKYTKKQPKPEPDAVHDAARCCQVTVRFLLGRTFCLYRITTLKDAFLFRTDSVEDVRAVLLDLQNAVSLLANFPDLVVQQAADAGDPGSRLLTLPENLSLKIEEYSYPLVYNSLVVAMRISKSLRKAGFAYVAIPVLAWISSMVNESFLPLQNIQFLSFRLRVLFEVISCLEASAGFSLDYLKSSFKAVQTGLAQVQNQAELENLVTPLPPDTKELLRICVLRMQALHAKFSFWSVNCVAFAAGTAAAAPGIPELQQLLSAVAPGGAAPITAGETPAVYLAAVLEAMRYRVSGGGARAFFSEFAGAATADAKALGLLGRTGKSPLPPRARRQTLRLKCFREVASEGAQLWSGPQEKERIELLKASGQYEAPETADGRPPEPKPEETEEFYVLLHDESVFKNLRRNFPLKAHQMLLESCVLLDYVANPATATPENDASYRELMDCLVLRLKYKHFFDPPLVEIDILVCETPNPDIPGGYVALTNDLNGLSAKNKRVAEQDAALAAQGDDPSDNPKKKVERLMAMRVREKGRHVFLVGKYFDPLMDWPGVPDVKLECHMGNKTCFDAYVPASGPETIDKPGIIQRICNVHVEFAVRPPVVAGKRDLLSAGIVCEPAEHKRFPVVGNSLLDFRGDDFDDVDLYRDPAEKVSASTAKTSTTPATAPWVSSNYNTCTADTVVDNLHFEAEAARKHFLQEGAETVVAHKCLPIPIEAHPAAAFDVGTEKIPFLTFSLYSEKAVHDVDPFVRSQGYLAGPYSDAKKEQNVPAYTDKAAAEELMQSMRGSPKAVKMADETNLLGTMEGGNYATKKNPNVPELPPENVQAIDEDALIKEMKFQNWTLLLDDFETSLVPIVDLGVIQSAQLTNLAVEFDRETGSVLNGGGESTSIVRADLRQTPEELLGKPFQNYLFLKAKTEQPAAVGVLGSRPTPPTAEDKSPQSVRSSPFISKIQNESTSDNPAANSVNTEKLAELVETLRLSLSGLAGQVFLAENADLLEDIVGKVYFRCVQPLIKTIEAKRHRNTVKEWLLDDVEWGQMASWCGVLKKTLPTLLKIMHGIGRFDALLLANLSWSLSRLNAEDGEFRLSAQYLKQAISRLEEDLDETKQAGSRTFNDEHPALAMSFDPPSLRPLSFAYYSHVANTYEDADRNFVGDGYAFPDRGVYPFDEDNCDTTSLLPKVKKRGHQPKEKKSPFAHKIVMDGSLVHLRDDTLVLPVQKRTHQEKVVVLMQLYDALMAVQLKQTRKNLNVLLGVPIMYIAFQT